MKDRSIFFTETAAKLLESQGYRAKAAEVYLFLSLNSMEKKDYYRERFEALESELVWIKKNTELIELLHVWLGKIAGADRLERIRNTRNTLLERKK